MNPRVSRFFATPRASYRSRVANLKHTTGVRTDGQAGGTYGTGASAKGRQPAFDGIVTSQVRQVPEDRGGVSTD